MMIIIIIATPRLPKDVAAPRGVSLEDAAALPGASSPNQYPHPLILSAAFLDAMVRPTRCRITVNAQFCRTP